MEWTIRIIEALASVMAIPVLLFLFVLLFGPRPDLPRGFLTQMVALELAESAEEAKAILGQRSSTVRKKVRGKLKGDFIFIAAYWLLFITLSALLAQRGFLSALLVATVAICITAAAQMDFLENLRLYALLDANPTALKEIGQRVKDVREAALFKFGLIFVATALLSPVFLWRDNWWLTGIGALYLIAAVVGLVGLWRRYPPAVEWGFLMLVLGVIPIALAFNFIPRESLTNVLAGS